MSQVSGMLLLIDIHKNDCIREANMGDKYESKNVDNCPLSYDYCYHYCYFYKNGQCIYEEFKSIEAKTGINEGNNKQANTSTP